MSAVETFEWRCMNCGEFHEYGQWKCYDLGWENQPRTCWEGYENPNSWNTPHHQYYGDHEHQPLEEEEPHQRQGSGGKKSLEEMLESFMARHEETRRNNRTAIRNLETQLQKLSRQLMEECQISTLSEEAISLEENEEEAWIEAEVEKRLAQKLKEEAWIEAEVQKRLAQKLQEEAWIEAVVQERLAQRLQDGFMDHIERNCKDQEELQIEENGTCELMEEVYVPQALEEEEEEEAPEEAFEVVIELECEKMVVEKKEQVVECEERKEVPIIDFVFGDKLMVNKEKPLSLSIYL